MNSFSFARLFSMPAFEGLRILRNHIERSPDCELESLIGLVRRVEPNANSYDLEAARALDSMVPRDAPHSGVMFYRVCIATVLLAELPSWAKLMTLGRGRFIKRLKAEEFRDIRSLFRQALLLEEPPSTSDVAWWDQMQARVRQEHDAEKLQRARQAEQLSIEFERKRLATLGIDMEPRWMAIEDNTVGYDVLSYNPGSFSPTNRLIEVKSTIASPLRFFLTRNEWNEALQYGSAYVFHVWDLQKSPPALFERTVAQITPHVPEDQAKGQWKIAWIPVGI